MSIPVIFDTDIGSDIDDTWALGFLLRCPELDVKLVTTDRGRPEYRAKLCCQVLAAGGRQDLPIGLGPDWQGNTGQTRQEPCAAGYKLSSYKGEIIPDGVQAIIDTILQSPDPITVIAIGPLPTIAEALRREPAIAQNARFIGMHGSLRKGHKHNRDTIVAEANVVNDASACEMVCTAPWPITLTPIDSCGIVQLQGEKYRRVVESADPLARTILTHYETWWKTGQNENLDQWRMASSILFDTVAVLLAFSEEMLVIEDLPVRITADGFTVIEQGAKTIRCATVWLDYASFEDLLVDRLTRNA